MFLFDAASRIFEKHEWNQTLKMSTATTRSTTRPASVPAPTFNYDAAIRDLNERSSRQAAWS
jgi:hypothetical protein